MTIQASPPAYVLVAGPQDCSLEVRFQQQEDRFGHSVSHITRQSRQQLLQSTEGSRADRWPASPPLQQCHQQQLADGRDAVMAVGQAGRGHWSLVAACRRDLPLIWFEVACRIRPSRGDKSASLELVTPDDSITRLGMAYGVSDPWQLTNAHSATFEGQHWRCELRIETGDESSVLQSTQEGLRLDVGNSRETHGPRESKGAMTKTWKYRVHLEPRRGKE